MIEQTQLRFRVMTSSACLKHNSADGWMVTPMQFGVRRADAALQSKSIRADSGQNQGDLTKGTVH